MSITTESVIVITGAASGIGRATAELMASEGARVVVADIVAAGAERVAEGNRRAGGRAVRRVARQQGGGEGEVLEAGLGVIGGIVADAVH